MTPLTLSSDNLFVKCDLFSTAKLSFKTLGSSLHVNSKIESPVICLKSHGGNIVLMPEALLKSQKVVLHASKIFIDGKITNQDRDLHIEAYGYVHVGMHGVIGSIKDRTSVPSLILQIKGDMKNYGQVIGSDFVKLGCTNFLSCAKCKEDTVHNCYGAVKYQYGVNHIMADNGANSHICLNQLCSSVRQRNISKVTEYLDRGADPNAGHPSAHALARSQFLKQFGNVEDVDLKERNEIAKILDWKVHARGEIRSGNVLEFNSDGDLNDCCQLVAKHLALSVKGKCVVEEGSFWHCGSITGNVTNDMLVEGTWLVNMFSMFIVERDLIVSDSGIIQISQGGQVDVGNRFVNRNRCSNAVGLLSIAFGTIQQYRHCSIESNGSLEIIVNNMVSDTWHGTISVANFCKIIAKSNVQLNADIKSGSLVEVRLERMQKKVTFDVCSEIEVEHGPLIIGANKHESDEIPERHIFRTKGAIHARSMIGSDVHVLFAAHSNTMLSSGKGAGVVLSGTEMYTEKDSLIECSVHDAGEKMIFESDDSWAHYGKLTCKNNSNDKVTIEFSVSKLIICGMMSGLDFVYGEVSTLFEIHTPLEVQDDIALCGGGQIKLEANSKVKSKNGSIAFEGFYLVHNSVTSVVLAEMITMSRIHLLRNAGTMNATTDMYLGITSVENILGTFNAQHGGITVDWLDEDVESIVQGFVYSQKLDLVSSSQLSVTMECSNTMMNERQTHVVNGCVRYDIPKDGLTIVCPMGKIILKSSLNDPGSELGVHLSSSRSFEFCESSEVESLFLFLPENKKQESVILDIVNGSKLLIHEMVVDKEAEPSVLHITGNVDLKGEGAILSTSCSLEIDGFIQLNGLCNFEFKNISFLPNSTTRHMVMEGSVNCFQIKAMESLTIQGELAANSKDNDSTDIVLHCDAPDMKITGGQIAHPHIALQYRDSLVVQENARVTCGELHMTGGKFVMRETACLTVVGKSKSFCKATDSIYLTGKLETGGSGTFTFLCKKNIDLNGLKCSMGNLSNHFESYSNVSFEDCHLEVQKCNLVIRCPMKRGTVSFRNTTISNIENQIQGDSHEHYNDTSSIAMESEKIDVLSADISAFEDVYVRGKMVNVHSSTITNTVTFDCNTTVSLQHVTTNTLLVYGKQIDVSDVLTKQVATFKQFDSLTIDNSILTDIIASGKCIKLDRARVISFANLCASDDVSLSTCRIESLKIQGTGATQHVKSTAVRESTVSTFSINSGDFVIGPEVIGTYAKLNAIRSALIDHSNIDKVDMAAKSSKIESLVVKGVADIIIAEDCHVRNSQFNLVWIKSNSCKLSNVSQITAGGTAHIRCKDCEIEQSDIYAVGIEGEPDNTVTIRSSNLDKLQVRTIEAVAILTITKELQLAEADNTLKISNTQANSCFLRGPNVDVLRSEVEHTLNVHASHKANLLNLSGALIYCLVDKSGSINAKCCSVKQLILSGFTIEMYSCTVSDSAFINPGNFLTCCNSAISTLQVQNVTGNGEDKTSLQECNLESLRITGNSVELGPKVKTKFAEVNVSGNLTISNSTLKTLHTSAKNVYFESCSENDICEVADVTTKEICSLSETRLANLQAKGGLLQMSSSYVTAQASLGNTECNILKSVINALKTACQKVAIENDSKITTADLRCPTGGTFDCHSCVIKRLRITGTMDAVLSDVNEIDIQQIGRTITINNVQASDCLIKGHEIIVKEARLANLFEVNAQEKAECQDVKARNARALAKNVFIGEVHAIDFLKLSSTVGNLEIAYNAKSKFAFLDAQKGQVNLNQSQSNKFDHLLLMQKKFDESKIKDLVLGIGDHMMVSNQLDISGCGGNFSLPHDLQILFQNCYKQKDVYILPK